jgi:L-asparaginase
VKHSTARTAISLFTSLLSTLTFFFVLGLAGTASGDPPRPQVVILATGGTIAGSAETQTQAGYTWGQVGVDTLLAAVPQLSSLADVRSRC